MQGLEIFRRNFNKLTKYQIPPKATKIDAFEQKMSISEDFLILFII